MKNELTAEILSNVTPADIGEITRTLVELAKDGDKAAARLLFNAIANAGETKKVLGGETLRQIIQSPQQRRQKTLDIARRIADSQRAGG